ncbi:Pls/PosA family non-ribosomal peptide synthetase [Methylocystis sp. Sn-Cys]|uniref:Pls/PosA family non-ribosomal peptide synthetase n=1 Tax=Methylocystis sp. Sn-Cys TaxID=1701263 RepID=UPI00192274C8|nr:Pls/PosA family non-ribosomal peptide synthetase [Methylocystis sp. Sn-Cys]MBL1258210.1 amino acid adenylation domain-containing protein [Methylocystis sp. Sn-Cys]
MNDRPFVLGTARTVQSAAPGFSVALGTKAEFLLRDELLCEIFAETAKRHPNANALKSLRHSISYRELDVRSDALRRGLLALGVGPGGVVGLWMARGTEALIAQLAIAKTGAAWLPFDAEAPVDRIAACLEDAEARFLLTSPEFSAKASGHLPAQLVIASEASVEGDDRLPTARELGATPEHPAYFIYTSGSTGKPKGTIITGRNICHYLRSANEIYGFSSSDVTFQGASLAFDLSMEEIWVSYLSGATLFVATAEILADLETLPAVLEQAGVTVLDTVPTLLNALPRDVATLRTIILGGEACPPSVAERWSRDGRVIYNSYGPTEATVVATIAEVRRGEAVTIGKPIPNYSCYVVDETLALLPPGAEGELLIGGPGVAKGYLKRDSLTAEKFIDNPHYDGGLDPILYRSGDAVILNESGDLVFRGRVDDQVKIRGFRVELGEIEAVIASHVDARQTAVVLRNDTGLDELVAFIVTDAPLPSERELRVALRKALPSYMVPSRFEAIASLPVLTSGKVDRKSLQAMPLSQQSAPDDEQDEPRNDIEARLLDAAKRALSTPTVPLEADFFMDLGGHSLLAARFVSIVRETPSLASITLHDLYAHRTLRNLAVHLRENAKESVKELAFEPPPLKRRVLCALAQLAILPFLLSISAAQWLAIFISYTLITPVNASFVDEAFSLFGIILSITVSTLVISIAGKWLVIGRTKPGRYPLWGFYFFRWWLSQRLLGLSNARLLQNSPLMPLYLAAIGAKIGRDAQISDLEAGAIDLISIGAGASLGSKLKIANARVEGNELVIGPVEIGADAYIGTGCVIEEGVFIGDGAALEDLTSLPAGSRVQANEIWDGSPGRRIGAVDPEALEAPAQATIVRRLAVTLISAALALFLPIIGLLPIFPAFWAFDTIEAAMKFSESEYHYYLAAIPLLAWPTAFVLVLATIALVAIFRWTVLPRAAAGRYSVWSAFYLRRWAVSLATEVALETLSSLYATLYMRTWYRLMGARIGKGSEIATNLAGRYDVVSLGENCFIADEVAIGDEDIRRGWMHLEPVAAGDRVFVGNDAVVPPGATLPSDVLIGVKSKPPAGQKVESGDTWFGSPPILMPARQKLDSADVALTFNPTRLRRFGRAAYEALNISLPSMLYITLGTWAVEIFGDKLIAKDYLGFAGLFILASMVIPFAVMLVAAGVKWTTMGRYRPQVRPMWSFWAIRNETSTVLYWGMTGRILLDYLRGTPFLPWVLRVFGAKFGKGVYMDMTDITEFDCVKVGDYCALNMGSALQTHLYEDRLMKIGSIEVGKGVTLGSGSTVLYDTHVGDYARLGPLTVVMKGETIPRASEWVGSPAEPA